MQAAVAIHQSEGQAGKRLRQARRKCQGLAIVAQTAEPGDRNQPGTCQRGEVEAVGCVAGQIVQIDEGGLTEVSVGQIEMPDFGGNDGLDRG